MTEAATQLDEQVSNQQKIPYDQQWLGSILRPALIALMIACLDIALLSFMVRFNPNFANGYAQIVVTISILAALFACAVTAWLAQPGRRQWRRPLFRLAEFCFVIIVARLLTWLLIDGFPSIEALLYRPLGNLLDGSFLFSAIIISLSWLLAGMMTDDMLRLALQPDELFAIENDRIGELIRTSNSDRPALLQRIVARWVGGGVLLVLIAASVRIDRPESGFFAITRQNIDPTVIAAVIIYFLAGLLLISQGQLAILRTRWLIDRVPASEQVLGRWPLYVFALLVAVGLVAGLLPFGGTFLLAQILYGIITFFFNAIFMIFQFFMGLLLLLIAAMGGESAPEEVTEPPPPITPPTMEELLPASNQMPEWAGGALFWIIMVAFLGYAAYIYFSDKGVKFSWLSTFWQMLRARWAELFSSYQQWQRTRATLQPLEAQASAGTLRKLFRQQRGWNRLDATARVRYFYLAMLDEAKDRGIARNSGETPLRYAPRLSEKLMDSGVEQTERVVDGESTMPPRADAYTLSTTDVHEGEVISSADTTALEPDKSAEREYTEAVEKMTTAFMRTRYGHHQIDEQEASVLEQLWKKIGRRMQRIRN